MKAIDPAPPHGVVSAMSERSASSVDVVVPVARASALHNGVWNGISVGLSSVVGLSGSILIVRSLTPEAYGELSYYLWLAGVVGILGTLAFPVALTKVGSELRGRGEYREESALARTLILVVGALNVCLTAALLIVRTRFAGAEAAYLLLIALVLTPAAVSTMLSSTLQSRELYRPVSLAVVAGACVQLALVTVAFLYGWGTTGYLAALFSTSIVVPIALVVQFVPRDALGRLIGAGLPSRSTVRRFGAFMFPQTFIILLDAVVWQRSEVFFLARFSSVEEIGYYSLAFTVMVIFLALGWAIVNGYFPALSHDFGASDWSRIRRGVGQAILLATMFAVPITFGSLSVLDGLITFTYGAHMQPAVPVAKVLSLGLVPGVVAAVFGLVLGALNRPWLIIPAGGLVAALNIALDVALIPPFGAIGGAIANTVAQVTFFALLLVIVQRLWGIVVPWRTVTGVVALGFVCAFAVPTLIQSWLPGPGGLVLAVVAAACCYVAALWRQGYLRSLMAAMTLHENRVDDEPRDTGGKAKT